MVLRDVEDVTPLIEGLLPSCGQQSTQCMHPPKVEKVQVNPPSSHLGTLRSCVILRETSDLLGKLMFLSTGIA